MIIDILSPLEFFQTMEIFKKMIAIHTNDGWVNLSSMLHLVIVCAISWIYLVAGQINSDPGLNRSTPSCK